MRIVLDSTVLVRSHPRSKSTGRKVLKALLESKHTLLISNEIIGETIKVLRYPRLQRLYALSDDELYDYAQFLQEAGEIVILSQPYQSTLLRDPNDLHVMQTAEHGEADILCSDDSDFHEPGIVLRCAALGVQVCKEAELLKFLTS